MLKLLFELALGLVAIAVFAQLARPLIENLNHQLKLNAMRGGAAYLDEQAAQEAALREPPVLQQEAATEALDPNSYRDREPSKSAPSENERRKDRIAREWAAEQQRAHERDLAIIEHDARIRAAAAARPQVVVIPPSPPGRYGTIIGGR